LATKTGTLRGNFTKHTDEVTSVAWLPDGKSFITISPDKNLYVWDLFGNVVRTWTVPRAYTVAINPFGTKVLVVCLETIHIYSVEGKDEGT